MQPDTLPMPTYARPGPQCDTAGPHLLGRLAAAVAGVRRGAPLAALATLHPCFVDGVRTLVFRRGLAREQPGLFERVRSFARSHGFALLEDRRRRELSCRDERRRLAPLMLFAAGLLGNTALADDGTLLSDGQAVVPTIEIVGQRAAPDRRPYINVGGKRFLSQPYGEVETILGVAAEVRSRGEHHRVRTRGLQMPSEYAGSFIDRYDYTMPGTCGGGSFSYYEGDDFAALGYHGADGKVVLDVLAGGGPFSAPRLWGAYDQVLNANVRMELMFGDGLRDGMGVLMASYKIGLMPVMRSHTRSYYGELYSRAIAAAGACQAPPLPQVRHAGTVEAAESEDAS